MLLSSAWPSPSFVGAYLPERRDIDATGFSAEWNVLHLGRSYPGEWRNAEIPAARIASSAFGVNLFVPVSTYQKSTRAAKYAILFIGLSFLAYFMFEVFGNLRLHPFQYLLVGFANCLFYLLLLSLSEHTGFDLAYTISAAASTLLVVGYSASILAQRSHAATMLALLAGLYAFLYVALRAEQYAMLIGAVARHPCDRHVSHAASRLVPRDPGSRRRLDEPTPCRSELARELLPAPFASKLAPTGVGQTTGAATA